MKRKIAMLLAAVMTVAMVPATALAKTDNSISRVVVLEKDKYTEIGKNAPYLEIDNEKGQVKAGQQFELVLDGAEWKIPNLLTDPTAPVEPTKVADPGAAPTEVADPGTAPTEVADPGAAPAVVADPGTAPTVVADPGDGGTEEEKQAYQTYLTEKAAYDTNKAAYDKYVAEKAAYDTKKAEYDEYVSKKADYDTKKTAYDKYIAAKETYDKAKDDYEQYKTAKAEYDLAKADYDKAKANYDNFKNNLDSDGYLEVGSKVVYDGNTLILLGTDTLSVTVGTQKDSYRFPILSKVTGDEGTVTIEPNDSSVSSGTYRFARTTSASATVKINGKVDIPEDGEKEIKPIIISETVAGALDDGKEIKLRLYGDFKFIDKKPTITATSDDVTAKVKSVTDDEIKLVIDRKDSRTATKLSITGIYVADDDAKTGEIAEIVVSGAGVEKTTLEVGTLITYGVKFTVEDKKLPVFYSGRKYDDDQTLKVTFKESVADSWWESRKTTLTFPEGVKVIDVEFGKDLASYTGYEIDKNVVTIKNLKGMPAKAEWTAKFNLSISPDFTGDITCTLGGPAVSEDTKVVVAEAEKAVTFEVESRDVNIDYRNVVVGDITIKEAFAGALEEDREIIFDLDEIGFEKGTKVEVVEGDIEFEDLDESDRTKGLLSLQVKKESYKTPATIKLTNVQVYLDRTLPAGNYPLKVKGDAIISNYADKNDIKDVEKKYTQLPTKEKDEEIWGCFDKSSYTLSDKYIKVVTAGRDRDDSSFTTKVVVTIGSYSMKAGDKEIILDAPAYISNSYTLLPVRAVADALSGNSATVLWDDATKTVTIAFGARIISMTIGSKTMNVNGVAIQMNAAPEITNSRTFLPLRDLSYALGLKDAQIAWDDTTKTVTLN